jgi:hypothetical protein
MKLHAPLDPARAREALCSRPVQLAARVALGVAIIAMFLGMHESPGSGHPEVWEVVAAGGFVLAAVSLPIRAYGLFMRSQRVKVSARNKGRG